MSWANRIFFFLFVTGITLGGANADGNSLIYPIFTTPNCGAYNYVTPVSMEIAGTTSGPSGNLFCTGKDFKKIDQGNSSVINAITKEVAGRKVESVFSSAYTYAEPSLAKLMCGLPFESNATITILAQSDGTGAGRVSKEFYAAISDCAIKPHFIYYGCDVFDEEEGRRSAAPCKSGRVNVVHLKMLQIIFTDGSTLLILGSGNFNRSLYANIDDWIVYRGDIKERSFPVSAICAAKSSLEISGSSPRAADLANSWHTCVSDWPELAQESGLILEFAPMHGDAYRQRMLKSIANADSIDVAAQALEDPDIINAILGNMNASKRFIVDDDWYWAARQGHDYYTASFTKTAWIGKIEKNKLRYLQTNHSAIGGIGNTLHTRMIITKKNGSATVFTGSAHLRRGSLSLNIEHLLTVTDPTLTAKYSDFFSDLWGRGVAWDHMPVMDAPIVP